nr:TonB-dependent receptor [uncultured Desulfobacter sp.]
MKIHKMPVLLMLPVFLMIPGIGYSGEPSVLSEITVTAQKKEEKVQDIPISISVFDEFSIEEKNIKSIQDLAAYTPNLMLTDNGGRASLSPTMRGLHTESGSFSPSVVMFVDGVPAIGTTGFDLPLTDISRVEVLKGPQGSLYGKGAEAGVINVITKKPGNEFSGKTMLELGSDNKREYNLSLHSPIVKDKLSIGISGRHYEKDGFIDNLQLGGASDDRQHNYGKVYLKFTPTDPLEVALISSVLKHDDGGLTWGLKNSPRNNESNREYIKTRTLSNALKIKFNKENYTFESITAQMSTDDIAWLDYDYTSNLDYEMQLNSELSNLSQEFRISRNTDKLDCLIGMNLYRDDNTLDYIMYMYGYEYPTYAEIEGESLGVFANVKYRITEKLSLEGGLRYDDNENHYKNSAADLDLKSTSSAVSPKFSFSYKSTPSSMMYTTLARGYRPAGFYAYAPEGYPKSYDKETLWSYEIGYKNTFLDNRLILNLAVYYMDINQMQVTSSIANSSYMYMSNAAEATSKGMELDLSLRLNREWELFFSAGYNDTTFDHYVDDLGDYSGNTNPYSPKYNYNIGARYRDASGYYARIDLNGYSNIYLDKENTTKRDAYHLVNLKLGFEAESYDIYLYGKNIFDKVYDSVGYSNKYTKYSPPREVGVQLVYRF